MCTYTFILLLYRSTHIHTCTCMCVCSYFLYTYDDMLHVQVKCVPYFTRCTTILYLNPAKSLGTFCEQVVKTLIKSFVK
jgi:hypothetical protein